MIARRLCRLLEEQLEQIDCRVIRGSSTSGRFPDSLMNEMESDGWHKLTAEWINGQEWELLFVSRSLYRDERQLLERVQAEIGRDLRLAIRADFEHSGIASEDNRFDFAAVHSINPKAVPEHWLTVTEDFEFDLWDFLLSVLSQPVSLPDPISDSINAEQARLSGAMTGGSTDTQDDVEAPPNEASDQGQKVQVCGPDVGQLIPQLQDRTTRCKFIGRHFSDDQRSPKSGSFVWVDYARLKEVAKDQYGVDLPESPPPEMRQQHVQHDVENVEDVESVQVSPLS